MSKSMWKYIETIFDKGSTKKLSGDFTYFIKLTDDGNLITILDDIDNIYHIQNNTVYHNTDIQSASDIHKYDNSTYIVNQCYLYILNKDYTVIIELRNQFAKFVYDVLIYRDKNTLYQLHLDSFKTNKLKYLKSDFSLYRDYVTLDTSILNIRKQNDILIISLNNKILIKKVNGHRFKYIHKYYLLDTCSALLQFRIPCTYRPRKSWVMYFDAKQDISIHCHVETVRLLRPLVQINKIFVCLKDIFFVLTKDALLYALLNGSFLKLISHIDNGKFNDSMYYEYDRCLPSFNDYENVVIYFAKNKIFASKTTYPFNIVSRNYENNAQSQFFTSDGLIINDYHSTEHIYL